MSNTLRSVAVAFSILLFFCLMSRIDFIVHGTLYSYGLQFSYAWAVEYWIMYMATFIFFSIAISLMYWLGSQKTIWDLKFSITLFATVNILEMTSLQDLMFFVFWAGGLPANDLVWWWSPWVYVFGTWTTIMQVTFTAVGIVVTIVMWLMAFGKPAFTLSALSKQPRKINQRLVSGNFGAKMHAHLEVFIGILYLMKECVASTF